MGFGFGLLKRKCFGQEPIHDDLLFTVDFLWAGLVFLPDSIGYLIGTNFFGLVARRVGRYACWLVSSLFSQLVDIQRPVSNCELITRV